MTIVAAGGNYTYDYNDVSEYYYLFPDSGIGLTLLGNVDITHTNFAIPVSSVFFYMAPTAFDLNGNTFTIEGISITQEQINAGFLLLITGADSSFLSLPGISNATFLYQQGASYITTSDIIDGSVTVAKLANLTRGSILLGNSSNRPAAYDAKTSGQILIGNGTDLVSVAVTGDVTITSGGVTSIGAGVIVNADINASAAIALSKLAALTASKPVVTNGSGVLTTANQISPAFGGTGQDFSASTGFATVAAGTFSVGAINETIQLQVSFESGYLGDFKIKMPYAGTVTGIYAYAIKAIAGTDNGTIVAKNNGGTTMTDGTITYTASDARGTAYTVSPSANNTFAAGDLLTFTTAKVTAGGVVQLSITVTRNN